MIVLLLFAKSESMLSHTGASGSFIEVSIPRESMTCIPSKGPALKIHQADNIISHSQHLRACPVAQVLRRQQQNAAQKNSLIGCNLVCPTTTIHGNTIKTMHGSW